MGCSATGCCTDCRTASATWSSFNDSGCCSIISTGEPTSIKKLWEPVSRSSDPTKPMAPPTVAPITVLSPLFGGTVRLDERHPGGGPVHPGGRVLVMVLLFELAAKWPINAPSPAPAAGKAKPAKNLPLPGSFKAYPSVLSSVTGPETGAT